MCGTPKLSRTMRTLYCAALAMKTCKSGSAGWLSRSVIITAKSPQMTSAISASPPYLIAFMEFPTAEPFAARQSIVRVAAAQRVARPLCHDKDNAALPALQHATNRLAEVKFIADSPAGTDDDDAAATAVRLVDDGRIRRHICLNSRFDFIVAVAPGKFDDIIQNRLRCAIACHIAPRRTFRSVAGCAVGHMQCRYLAFFCGRNRANANSAPRREASVPLTGTRMLNPSSSRICGSSPAMQSASGPPNPVAA